MHLKINHNSFISETKEVSSSEELVLNTVATINNLSFYNTKTSAITTLQVRVLEGTHLDCTVFCYLWATLIQILLLKENLASTCTGKNCNITHIGHTCTIWVCILKIHVIEDFKDIIFIADIRVLLTIMMTQFLLQMRIS